MSKTQDMGVLELAVMSNIGTEIHNHRRYWKGHLIRKDDKHLAKQALNEKIKGTKRRMILLTN